MTAKEQLDYYRASAQYRVTIISLGIYFIVLALFVVFMDKVPAEHRLTVLVLLLTPLAGVINSAAAFWLNRSREDGSEKPPTITTSSTPDGGSTAKVVPAGAPTDATPAAQTATGAVVASDGSQPAQPGGG